MYLILKWSPCKVGVLLFYKKPCNIILALILAGTLETYGHNYDYI